MSSQSLIVLSSASTANPNKLQSIQSELADNDRYNIEILNTTTMVLNQEQQQSLSIENASQFFNGPITAYLLQNKTEFDFETFQKSNKLSKNDIFSTNDPFFVAKLKQILFPQKASMQQTLIICDPSLSQPHFNEIIEELKLKGIFVLFEDEISSENNSNIIAFFNQNEEKQETDVIKCRVIFCESIGCIDKIKLIIGCNDNKFIQISDELKFKLFIPQLNTQQTLALIKPEAVKKGYAQDIINEIEVNGFTIISQKRIQLKIEHAQHFYKEHEGKPFFEELTSFMSSGEIYAFILERIEAIKCWRILLGPTNTFTAKEKASQSLRGRYGTNQTANACHGSDSMESAKREIKFYFPESTQSNICLNEVNIVEEYMSQKLENDESLKEFLIRGLSELAKQKPGSKLQVVEWFGNWLLNNNPNKPQIDEPNDMILID